MRCRACNIELNDAESTFKDENGEFVDMCSECLTNSYDNSKEDELYDLIPVDLGEKIDE